MGRCQLIIKTTNNDITFILFIFEQNKQIAPCGNAVAARELGLQLEIKLQQPLLVPFTKQLQVTAKLSDFVHLKGFLSFIYKSFLHGFLLYR